MWPAMIALAAVVVWAASSSRAREHLHFLAGKPDYAASFQSFGSRILPLLLCLALLISLNPETRILLLAIDAVGVDVSLLLVLIQLQVGFEFVQRAWVEDLRTRVCGWGPVLPHWRTLTNAVVDPSIAVCASSALFVALIVLLIASLLQRSHSPADRFGPIEDRRRSQSVPIHCSIPIAWSIRPGSRPAPSARWRKGARAQQGSHPQLEIR